ncbi:hypothetical protein BJ742DRAFT_841136 [Cladochytrium replicatum]|nr:hypothetical protein BJ742DRAFT_841136 [Cladochytrium replicatum]
MPREEQIELGDSTQHLFAGSQPENSTVHDIRSRNTAAWYLSIALERIRQAIEYIVIHFTLAKRVLLPWLESGPGNTRLLPFFGSVLLPASLAMLLFSMSAPSWLSKITLEKAGSDSISKGGGGSVSSGTGSSKLLAPPGVVYVAVGTKSGGIWAFLFLGLILAAISNAALCFRFLDKNVLRSTHVLIWSALAQGIVLEVLVLFHLLVSELPDDTEFSEGLYQSLASGTCSILASLSFAWDYWRHRINFELRGSGLSRSQRKLIVMVTVAIQTLGFGGLVYQQLEGWNFNDGVFFCVVTLTLIGLTNRTPKTVFGKLFLFVYTIFGVAIIALTIAAIREVLLENFHDRITQEYRRISDARATASSTVDTLDRATNSSRFNTPSSSTGPLRKSSYPPIPSRRSPETLIETDRPVDVEVGAGEGAMTQDMSGQLRFALIVTVGFWFGSAILFSWIEDWDFIDSVYFCFVVLMTIGYGDLVPQSGLGLLLLQIFIFVGMAVITYMTQVAISSFRHSFPDGEVVVTSFAPPPTTPSAKPLPIAQTSQEQNRGNNLLRRGGRADRGASRSPPRRLGNENAGPSLSGNHLSMRDANHQIHMHSGIESGTDDVSHSTGQQHHTRLSVHDSSTETPSRAIIMTPTPPISPYVHRDKKAVLGISNPASTELAEALAALDTVVLRHGDVTAACANHPVLRDVLMNARSLLLAEVDAAKEHKR